MSRCNLCFGRGYRPEQRRSRKGFYARTCSRCGGCGSVPEGKRNPEHRSTP